MRAAVLCLALLAAAVPRLFAEVSAEGAVAGRVADGAGAALPGVTVELSGPGVSPARVESTDSAGAYRFDGLPSGTYEVSFRLIGFVGVQRRDVAVTRRGVCGERDPAPLGVGGRSGHRQEDVSQPRRRDRAGREPRRDRERLDAGRRRRRADRSASDREGRRRARPSPASSSASTRGRARPTSTTCADSTWTTAPISPPRWPGCRSTCRHTRTGMATRI